MFEKLDRCKENHAGSGVTHHLTYTFTHVRTVTMRKASSASTLAIAISAMGQSQRRIFHQSLTFRANLRISLFVPAIDAYHEIDYPYLFLNSRHQCVYGCLQAGRLCARSRQLYL